MSGRKKKTPSVTQAASAAAIATKTGLTKAQVNSVFEAALALIAKETKAGKAVTLPKIGLKFTRKHVAAKKARMGPKPGSPGEMIQYKAKPAHYKPKVTMMKALKEKMK